MDHGYSRLGDGGRSITSTCSEDREKGWAGCEQSRKEKEGFANGTKTFLFCAGDLRRFERLVRENSIDCGESLRTDQKKGEGREAGASGESLSIEKPTPGRNRMFHINRKVGN